MYSISFIAIDLLCSFTLQKCVLTLDDVMLQVQRIYVNSGSGGGGARRCRGQKLPDITRFIYSLNEKANMQHLKDCTGKQENPDARRVEPLIVFVLPLKNGVRTTL